MLLNNRRKFSHSHWICVLVLWELRSQNGSLALKYLLERVFLTIFRLVLKNHEWAEAYFIKLGWMFFFMCNIIWAHSTSNWYYRYYLPAVCPRRVALVTIKLPMTTSHAHLYPHSWTAAPINSDTDVSSVSPNDNLIKLLINTLVNLHSKFSDRIPKIVIEMLNHLSSTISPKGSTVCQTIMEQW